MKTTLVIKDLTGTKESLRCRNLIQKDFCDIQGVYGLAVDMIANVVEITHTDEVDKQQLILRLKELGYIVDKSTTF